MAPGMVIIGAGECGGCAALALRAHGYAGPVTLIGAEPHAPYERPPLSKAAITDEGAPAPTFAASAKALGDLDITFLPSTRATAIDRARRRVRLADGAELPYARLLLATGALPRRLPLASPRCAYLRTYDDALSLRARLRAGVRVAVIGGGYIGLELASSARRLGCPVTVIEAQPRLLTRGVPAPIAAVLQAEHERHGTRVLCGQSITEIKDLSDAARIALADGTALDADLVIVGIGAVPDTALAESAGLAIANGIAVDDRLRTADPLILAAGDCCSFPLALYGGRRVRLESWRHARDQGALAGRVMAGADEAQAAVPWFWSDQFDLGLQIAGLPDEGAETVRRDLGNGAFLLFHLAADGRLVAASGIGPGNAVARDIRLAEMLIARRAVPPMDKLVAPDVRLKGLLAS
jgi:3-phenylpropionate/trans-cinnamate dioxygenase ferredoxin reductase subunit